MIFEALDFIFSPPQQLSRDRARSLSPKRNHQRPPAPPSRLSGGANHTWGSPQPLQESTAGASSSKGRGCRSISPRPVARRVGGVDNAVPWGSSGANSAVPARGRQVRWKTARARPCRRSCTDFCGEHFRLFLSIGGYPNLETCRNT